MKNTNSPIYQTFIKHTAPPINEIYIKHTTINNDDNDNDDDVAICNQAGARAKQKRRLPPRIIAHKLSYTRRTLSLEVTMRMRGISQALLRD